MLPRMGQRLPWFVSDIWKRIFFFFWEYFFCSSSSPEASATINCTSHCPLRTLRKHCSSLPSPPSTLAVRTCHLILLGSAQVPSFCDLCTRPQLCSGLLEGSGRTQGLLKLMAATYLRLWTTENSAWKRTKFRKFSEEPAGTQIETVFSLCTMSALRMLNLTPSEKLHK